jgi:hypothetical protein
MDCAGHQKHGLPHNEPLVDATFIITLLCRTLHTFEVQLTYKTLSRLALNIPS